MSRTATPLEVHLPLSVRHIRHIRITLNSSALVLACLTLPCRSAAAQSTTSMQTDATVLPRRTFGVRVLTGFARFDELLGTGGPRHLAARFNVDTVDDHHIAQLAYTRFAVKTLSGNSGFVVKAGSIVAAANSRVVTAPL